MKTSLIAAMFALVVPCFAFAQDGPAAPTGEGRKVGRMADDRGQYYHKDKPEEPQGFNRPNGTPQEVLDDHKTYDGPLKEAKFIVEVAPNQVEFTGYLNRDSQAWFLGAVAARKGGLVMYRSSYNNRDETRSTQKRFHFEGQVSVFEAGRQEQRIGGSIPLDKVGFRRTSIDVSSREERASYTVSINLTLVDNESGKVIWGVNETSKSVSVSRSDFNARLFTSRAFFFGGAPLDYGRSSFTREEQMAHLALERLVPQLNYVPFRVPQRGELQTLEVVEVTETSRGQQVVVKGTASRAASKLEEGERLAFINPLTNGALGKGLIDHISVRNEQIFITLNIVTDATSRPIKVGDLVEVPR